MPLVLSGSTGIVEGNIADSAITSNKIASNTITASDIANGTIPASKLTTGKFIKQMKHVRMDSQMTTSSNGNITALSLTFDSPVTVGNQILVMASGVVVAGTESGNWGAGCDLFLDDSCLTSSQVSTGTGNYIYQGAIDNNSDGGWGTNFGLKGIGVATSTNPTIALKVNRQLDWSWIGLGYTGTGYGKASTNLVAIEFGV